EPYFDFNKKLRAMQVWRPVYPRQHDKDEVGKIRVVMLVSRRIATDSWARLNMESRGVVGISLEMAECIVCIFNIYNDGGHSRSIHALNFYLQSTESRRMWGRNVVDIWVGDFNCHHPMWDHPCNLHLFTRSNLEAVEWRSSLQ
ncbi:hypothetical protein J132_06971, partial [Termitomyces sp. J132]